MGAIGDQRLYNVRNVGRLRAALPPWRIEIMQTRTHLDNFRGFAALAAVTVAALTTGGCDFIDGFLDEAGTERRIESITPTSGPKGTPVTLRGARLGTPQPGDGGHEILLVQKSARIAIEWGNPLILSWTDDEIEFIIPESDELAAGLLGIKVAVAGTESNGVQFEIIEPITSSVIGWVVHSGEPKALHFSTIIKRPHGDQPDWEIDLESISYGKTPTDASVAFRNVVDFGRPDADVRLLDVRAGKGTRNNSTLRRAAISMMTGTDDPGQVGEHLVQWYEGEDYGLATSSGATGINPAELQPLTQGSFWEAMAVLGVGGNSLTIQAIADGRAVAEVPLGDLAALLPLGHQLKAREVLQANINNKKNIVVLGDDVGRGSSFVATFPYSYDEGVFSIPKDEARAALVGEKLSGRAIVVKDKLVAVVSQEAGDHVAAYSLDLTQETAAPIAQVSFEGYTVRDLLMKQIGLSGAMLWVALDAEGTDNDLLAGIDSQLLPVSTTTTYAELRDANPQEKEAEHSTSGTTDSTHIKLTHIPAPYLVLGNQAVIAGQVFYDGAATAVTAITMEAVVNVTTIDDGRLNPNNNGEPFLLDSVGRPEFGDDGAPSIKVVDLGAATEVSYATTDTDFTVNFVNEALVDFAVPNTAYSSVSGNTFVLVVNADPRDPKPREIDVVFRWNGVGVTEPTDAPLEATAAVSFTVLPSGDAIASVAEVPTTADGERAVSDPYALYGISGSPFVFATSHADGRVAVINGWGALSEYIGDFETGAEGPTRMWCSVDAQF